MKKLNLRGATAAGVLVVAVLGGAVGGAVALSSAQGDPAPSTVGVHQVVDEVTPTPTPVVTPDPTPTPVVHVDPAPASDPAPKVDDVTKTETASEAADRAKAEADRAKSEADRATQVVEAPPAAPSAPGPGPGTTGTSSGGASPDLPYLSDGKPHGKG